MINLGCIRKTPRLNRQEISEKKQNRVVSLQMLFCNEGTLQNQNGMEAIRDFPGILEAGFLLKEGTKIRKRENSTQRAGYFIGSGNSRKEVNKLTEKCYSHLHMTDPKGKPLLHWNPEVLLPHET